MKTRVLLWIFCIAFILTGCSSLSLSQEDLKDNTWEDSGFIRVGKNLTVQNTDERLTLLNNIDALSADGLYYAAWTIGDSVPYENSDGDTVDLYDAQLYLLLGEFPTSEEAQDTMDKWLDAAKSNYEIVSEEEITCGGQSYILITYRFTSEDNPYDNGISAFGTINNNALCIELTCQKDFDMDLRDIMTHFLGSLIYGTESKTPRE